MFAGKNNRRVISRLIKMLHKDDRKAAPDTDETHFSDMVSVTLKNV